MFECAEPTGQVTPDWRSADLANVDRSKIHALNGSVYVKGAEPGDTLEVAILDMQHKGWGWTAHMAGFGLLAEDFDFNYLHKRGRPGHPRRHSPDHRRDDEKSERFERAAGQPLLFLAKSLLRT